MSDICGNDASKIEPAVAPAHEAQQAPLPPEAERRQLTVVFSDLAASASLASQLDPEDFREIIRAYHQACAPIVSRYDGHIAQYMGDGVLLYFGYPRAHDDSARRAVQAALDLIADTASLAERVALPLSQPLESRAGMHTGLVVIGAGGDPRQHAPLAMGEALHIAARLQELAEPGTVVISEATWRLVRGAFTSQALGAQHLRGIRRPMPAYRVLAAVEASPQGEVAATSGAPLLVGRSQELALLRHLWQQAREGAGQVAVLSGEAGIGKSRLVDVLKSHIASAPHTRLECRGLPHYRHIPLHPVIDLCQQACGWQAQDSPAEKLAKLEQTLGDQPDAPEAVSLLAALLAIPLPAERYAATALAPQRQRQRTLEIVLRLISKLADQNPLLLIVEDVQWIDPTSLDLIGLLIDQVATVSTCLLLTCRPEFQAPWPSRAYLTSLVLKRLRPPQVMQLVAAMTGGKLLPSEVMQHVFATTDGVPLFVEEMTKTILEADFLREREQRYEVAGPLPSFTIPVTLQDSLMARLDRLTTAKAVAQLAATIGREFSYTLLRAVSPWSDAVLTQELRRLVEAELLYQHGVGTQATYTFKHSLIREAAYQSLLIRTRQRYHQQIGEAILARHQGDLKEWASTLAHHFVESGDAEKAVLYLTQTWERALSVYANAEALHALEQAWSILERMPTTASVCRQRIDLARQLASLHTLMGHYEASLPYFTQALNLARQVGDPHAEARLESRLGRTYYVMGDYANAMACHQRALALAQEHPDSIRMAICYQGFGHIHFSSGRLSEATSYFMQALALAEADAHQEGIVVNCIYVSNALARAGQLVEALHWGKRAFSLATALHHEQRLAWACIMLAQAYNLVGDFGESANVLDRALQLCDKVGDFLGRAWVHIWYAELAALHHRDFERALAYSQHVIEMGTKSHGFQHEVSHQYARGAEYLLRLGRHQEAMAYCRQGLDLALPLANKLESGYAYMVMAELYATAVFEDWPKADTYLQESFNAFDEVGAQVDIGRAYLAAARIARRRQNGQGQELAEKARQVFVAHGAKALLPEVDRVRNSLA